MSCPSNNVLGGGSSGGFGDSTDETGGVTSSDDDRVTPSPFVSSFYEKCLDCDLMQHGIEICEKYSPSMTGTDPICLCAGGDGRGLMDRIQCIVDEGGPEAFDVEQSAYLRWLNCKESFPSLIAEIFTGAMIQCAPCQISVQWNMYSPWISYEHHDIRTTSDAGISSSFEFGVHVLWRPRPVAGVAHRREPKFSALSVMHLHRVRVLQSMALLGEDAAQVMQL